MPLSSSQHLSTPQTRLSVSPVCLSFHPSRPRRILGDTAPASTSRLARPAPGEGLPQVLQRSPDQPIGIPNPNACAHQQPDGPRQDHRPPLTHEYLARSLPQEPTHYHQVDRL
ncbi:hypothetical protein B0T18DRAFT_415481 [Schizothecium vesticola]|uniref:Uncharacterized protein n=1 Tax=Schizothecium vesticola TaxID=314040 RepID=A0AA40K2K2_9PEZI|nr:hypothetical protein B0T18DRAFT_415481 [Schizothecium vesticola]